MGGGTSGGAGIAIVGGEGSRGATVCTHSAISVAEEVCVAPPSEVYRKVGTQPTWRWGPSRLGGGDPAGLEVCVAPLAHTTSDHIVHTSTPIDAKQLKHTKNDARTDMDRFATTNITKRRTSNSNS
jgi:hypothetical protein